MSLSLRAFARAIGAVCLLVSAVPAHAQIAAGEPEAPVLDTYEVRQQASFEIWSGDTRLGTEKFRIYASHDTLITASTVRLDGASPTSALPFEKRTTFLQRVYDSYPLMFQISQQPRSDTTATMSLNCVFRDTSVTIYKEAMQRGVGTSVALPPGRLYILEPGVYLQVQLLLADFLAGSQDTRRQAVLIPSVEQVVDLYLTRGPVEAIVVRGKRVNAQRVDFTDKLTSLVGWVDKDGKMWKLEAPGQGLRVERGPDLVAKAQGPSKSPAMQTARPRKRPATGGTKP
ncbi:MAG: hypothetical protein ABI960_07030 [Candidatus Eisenbacteria bacterium]